MQNMTKLLIVAFLVAACGCSRTEQSSEGAAAPVQVADVRQASIQRIVTADGILYARDQASVVPKISAPVQTFLVNRGDHVQRGQVLAILENRDLKAAVLEGKAQYERAQASYRGTASASVPEEVIKAQSDVQAASQALDAAKLLYESRQKLYQEGALARRLVDEARVAFVQARSQDEAAREHLRALQDVGKQEQIKAADADVQAAKGRYEATQAQLDYSEIRSPISGAVTDRPIYAGEMASAGSPLLTVMDLSRVIARANVPLSDASYVHTGDPATLQVAGDSSAISGKVTVVSPAVDPNSTTIQVWVEAPNPGERLKPGATVHVAIVTGTVPGALVIPTAALLPSGAGTSSVMVVGPDSTARERRIQLGVREGDRVQVTSGLSSGERVITVGGLGLTDGAKVRVEGAPAPAKP